MTGLLKHRGPDGGATWIDDDSRVALGHRRLSILDLNQRANQPIICSDKRYVMIYNGEIYNFNSIRKSLSMYDFVTKSDTEVLLAAVKHWGVRKTLRTIQGMYVFGIWDKKTKNFYLCRDKLGIKPCYWVWQHGVLGFGSELKSILTNKYFHLSIDPNSLQYLLDFNFIPSPQSIFSQVRQLEPGQLLILKNGGVPYLETYWSLLDEKIAAKKRYENISIIDSCTQLDSILNQTIKRYMVSDVPLGSFLSGGIDSSLVSAIAAKYTNNKLKTFSLGFTEVKWDETDKAKLIASHIGTEHYEFKFSGHQALNIVELIPEFYDEPFADFSQLPTLALCEFAREQVKVCLSGDGGDELFGGYTRYSWIPKFWRLMERLPLVIRTLFFKYFSNRFMFSSLIPLLNNDQLLDEDIIEILDELPKKLPLGREILYFKDFYGRIMQNGSVSLFRSETPIKSPDILGWCNDTYLTKSDQMQLADIRHYMADGILTKVDRASMSKGLEVRIPLLDESITYFALGLPETVINGEAKMRSLQKSVLYKYVPQRLVDYPKMGFGFPIDIWLRTHLKEWASDLLSARNLKEIPYVNIELTRKLWSDHLTERSAEHWRLWPVLMYAQWYRRWSAYIA